MKIVIPMAGEGNRFREKGFKEIKPLIKIGNKPMIQHVIEMFPGEEDFVFICQKKHLEDTKLKSVLKKLKPKSTIAAVEDAGKGPVHNFLRAEKYIPDNEEIIVNYCDFWMEWNYKDFLSKARQGKYDGALPAFRGFHPASLGSTYYAYMRTDKNNNLLEIREKKSFSSNRMDDFASTGTHYFSSGKIAKKYAKELIGKNINVNKESYFSLPFNLLVGDGLKALVYEVKKFLCFGTPRDVNQYMFWHDVFNKKMDIGKKIYDYTALIPAAGKGKRFSDSGHKIPKPLIKVDNEEMIVKSVKSLPKAKNYIFVCLEEQLKKGLEKSLKKNFSNCRIVSVKETTKGMANTCLLAKGLWDAKKPLLISACDYRLAYDIYKFNKLVNDKSVDVIIWTFKNHECVMRNPNAYAYVAVDSNGFAAKIVEKSAISAKPGNDHAVVSVFWYRTADLFEEGAMKLLDAGIKVGGEYYVATSINALIQSGKKVVPFEVEKFICFGTPEDLQEYNYWKGCFQNQKQ